jgi:hypothetical protein
MRQLTGLVILLYGLLLGLNTGLPAVAELAGDQVQATVFNSDCRAPLGKPPFGGVYGICTAQWAGADGQLTAGQVFGDNVVHVTAAGVFTYPLLRSFAVLPPGNTNQVAAIISVLIIALGIQMLVMERKRAPGSEELASDP